MIKLNTTWSLFPPSFLIIVGLILTTIMIEWIVMIFLLPERSKADMFLAVLASNLISGFIGLVLLGVLYA